MINWRAIVPGMMMFLAACGGAPPPEKPKVDEALLEVQVFVVPPADTTSQRPYTTASTLTVEREADLTAQEGGRLEAVLADQGQKVQQGAVLARVEDQRLRKQIDQDHAEAQMLEVQAREAEVLRQAAEVELKRQTELRNEGLGSLRDFDRARFNLEAMRQEVAKAGFEHQKARAKAEENEIRLSRMQIKAPFDGIVSRRYARVGQLLLRDEKVLRVTELRPLMVRFTVPESTRHAAQVGALLDVFPADPSAGAARARVVRTGLVVDASSGSVECTAQLVEPIPSGLVPGMAVDVRVAGTQPGSARETTIPSAATRRMADGNAELFVIVGDHLQRRTVKLGRETGAGVQVIGGVAPGDRVVSPHSDKLRDAMRVRVRP